MARAPERAPARASEGRVRQQPALEAVVRVPALVLLAWVAAARAREQEREQMSRAVRAGCRPCALTLAVRRRSRQTWRLSRRCDSRSTRWTFLPRRCRSSSSPSSLPSFVLICREYRRVREPNLKSPTLRRNSDHGLRPVHVTQRNAESGSGNDARSGHSALQSRPDAGTIPGSAVRSRGAHAASCARGNLFCVRARP